MDQEGCMGMEILMEENATVYYMESSLKGVRNGSEKRIIKKCTPASGVKV